MLRYFIKEKIIEDLKIHIIRQVLPRLSLSFCSRSYFSYWFSCFTNPRFGQICLLFFFIYYSAVSALRFLYFIKYAATIEGLRETPAWQWTNTLVWPIFSLINLLELLKKHLIFYRALSDIKIRKCLMFGLIKRLFYPNTDIIAPMWFLFSYF